MEANKIDVKFGYSCNNNCIHCVIAGHRERLKREGKPIDRETDELKCIIQDASTRDISSLVFTGGEVTIRKDFLELLQFTVDRNLGIGLQTNGRVFCVEKFARKTLEIAPEMHFEVAIHSDRREMHDRITRVGGSFDQTLSGIKNLVGLQVESLNLKVVISRLNFRDLARIVEMAKDLGVAQVDISFPHGMGNALRYWKKVIPSYGEIHPFVSESVKRGNRYDVDVTYEAIPFCFLKGYEKHVVEIAYLEDWMAGETSELMQIGDPKIDWQKNRLCMKAKPKNCRNCKYFNICEGVWEEYIDFFGADEFEPVEGEIISSIQEIHSLLNHSR